jgi:hypothetical protein
VDPERRRFADLTRSVEELQKERVMPGHVRDRTKHDQNIILSVLIIRQSGKRDRLTTRRYTFHPPVVRSSTFERHSVSLWERPSGGCAPWGSLADSGQSYVYPTQCRHRQCRRSQLQQQTNDRMQSRRWRLVGSVLQVPQAQSELKAQPRRKEKAKVRPTSKPAPKWWWWRPMLTVSVYHWVQMAPLMVESQMHTMIWTRRKRKGAHQTPLNLGPNPYLHPDEGRRRAHRHHAQTGSFPKHKGGRTLELEGGYGRQNQSQSCGWRTMWRSIVR